MGGGVADGVLEVGVNGVKGCATAAGGACEMTYGLATLDGDMLQKGVYHTGDGACAAAGSAMMVASGPTAMVAAIAIEKAIEAAIDELGAHGHDKNEMRKLNDLRKLLSKAKGAKTGNPMAIWSLLREVQDKGIPAPGLCRRRSSGAWHFSLLLCPICTSAWHSEFGQTPIRNVGV